MSAQVIKLDATQPTPTRTCPCCGHVTNFSTGIDANGESPKPNDISVCAGHGCILLYNDDMTFRQMTDDEFKSVDPRVQSTVLMMSNHFRQARLDQLRRE